MRGFVEPRSLATVLTKRARGPSCTRNYSAGIGRGRGEGPGSYGDTEESVFSATYGHGVPLNSAGRGAPLNAGFLDGRGSRNPSPGAPNANSGFQSGSPSAGRGFSNPNQTDAFSSRRPLPEPSSNFGFTGFGRGKPVEKVAAPEDIFSSDSKSSLSSWSKWDEKPNKFDVKDGASLAESRLLGEDESMNVLKFPAAPQKPSHLGQDRHMQGLQSSTSATPFRSAPFQQPPPPSSHGREPTQQTRVDARVQPQPSSYMVSSTGWQQPIQQSYHDVGPRLQSSVQYPPPLAGMDQSYQYTDKQAVSLELDYGKPYQGTLDGSVEQTSYFSTSARASAQEGVAKSYPDPTNIFSSETKQSQWASNTPKTNQQTPAAFAMGDWHSVPTSESMEQPYFSQDLSESNQGQYFYGSQAVQPPSVAPDTSDVSGYEYDWGQPVSGTFQDSKEQSQVEAPIHAHEGLYYDQRIEECFKQGKLEDIDDIYNQMRAAQVQASAKSYGTILQSYMQLGKMDKVSVVYQEMSGVLFTDKKTENEQTKEIPSAATRESPTMHHIEDVASSPEISNAAQSAQNGPEFEEYGGVASSRISSEKDSQSAMPNTDTQEFSPIGRSESIAKTGMGRGKNMNSFFNFDFSGGLGSGGSTHYGTENVQVDKGSSLEMPDDYSQTFTPVLEPGWYAFAPQGVSVGPGAGRGRPHSPQAGDLGIGSSSAFPSQQFDSGAGQGRSSYEQRMQVALQQSSPLYSRDAPVESDHEYPEEAPQPWLSTEEAAERAMRILDTRLSRRYRNVVGWDMNTDDDAARVRRRPSQLRQAKLLNDRKQPKMPVNVEKEIHLTEEEAKKEADRLKAIEENEALQELHYTLEQFMKCYGEMALEPEHELGDFTNPDIEEKPFMPLDEYLEKAKPNIMKTGLIRSEKEWQNMINETLKYAPYFEEFVERYSGPGRYTAKQENDDLEEIASTLPSDVGHGAKAFVQRSLTTLKSNPGFNLDEKQWMLATMVDEFSQYSVQD